MKTVFKYIVYVIETFEYNLFFRSFYGSDISPFANLDIKSFRGHLERNEEDADTN
ncbi:hypothetical protein WKH56_19900 [Priestia sp. SB1]|uniref:hypothetical protein n=1 Tax=Priestia sp. SB1 TaxID=3132359 RepID=UPI003176EFA6